MSNSDDKPRASEFLDTHPELRVQVEHDPEFQALLIRMHRISLHGEVLYLRPSELLGVHQGADEVPVWIGQDDVPKDKDQLIVEYAQKKPQKFPVIHQYRP